MNDTKLSWPTIATAIIATFVAPWLVDRGFNLSADQTAWLTASLVSLPTVLVHALHNWMAKRPDKVTTVAKVLLPLALVLPLMTGCATLSKVETAISSPSAQPYLQAAADVAVATAEAKGITAAQITTIAQQALAADQGTAATLATVAAVANAEIAKLGLPAGDVQAAQILEAALTVAIQAQIGNNASIAQAQAAVAVVLNAILAAANPTMVIQSVPSSSAPTTAAPHGAPPAPTSSTDVPAQNKHFVLASVESPQVVGASASLVLVASLQAFGHVSVSAPTAAAVTVLLHG